MRWLMFSALIALAGLSVLNGCAQIHDHDTLADLLKGRDGPNVTPHITPSQGPSVDPSESASTKLLSDVIQAGDVLTIQVGAKAGTSNYSSNPSRFPANSAFGQTAPSIWTHGVLCPSSV